MRARLRWSLLAVMLVQVSCSGDNTPAINQPPPPSPKPPDTSNPPPDSTDTQTSDTEIGVDDSEVWADTAADTTEDTDTSPDVPPTHPGDPYLSCDAGDEAWVKQMLPVLLGRKPQSIREVRVLVDMVEKSSREEVARGLMNSPDFLDRWKDWFMDELRVNRAGDKMHVECYSASTSAGNNKVLAEFVRDNPALNSDPGFAFNMTDVLLSSLRLDDLSPYYRAHLFAMMVKPITGANVGQIAMDITRRQDFGEIFEATYLHRNVVCAGCHNSQFSTTDNIDPALDRHFPITGHFEKAIYGVSAGIPEMEVYSIFRHLGIVRENGGKRPWNGKAACGRFQPPEDISNDPAEFTAYFIEALGSTGSIWDTERLLQEGFDELRENGLFVDPETLDVNGQSAFAYLVSARVVNQVWREVYGYPLTLVHYFPRNEAQKEILEQLTVHFINEQWSLKSLLSDMVLHPLFNDNAPIDGCGDTAYGMPPVFNPWVLAESDPEKQDNSVGDAVHRYNARVLLRMISTAMYWVPTPNYPEGGEQDFQKAVGVFVKDSEPGFEGVDFQGLLAWESRFGACQSLAGTGSDPESCFGHCDDQAPSGCYCDGNCLDNGDCCSDYKAICVNEDLPNNLPIADDWIDSLETTVNNFTPTDEIPYVLWTHAVRAMKDRLITEPTLDPAAEVPLIEALLDVTSLDQPLSETSDWPQRLRTYCGVLLESPQFLLAGVPSEDQETEPVLVVGNTSYKSLCIDLRYTVFDPTVYAVTCTADGLEIEAASEGPI